MKHIVKRGGHSEPYDIKKLYASIYSVCLSVRTPEGEAELVAERVTKHVSKWLDKKREPETIVIGIHGFCGAAIDYENLGKHLLVPGA